jgi:inhibitor of KinA
MKPLSDRSLLVIFGNTIDAVLNDQVIFLHKQLLQSGFPGFIESVPSYASLAVFFDAMQIKYFTQTPVVDFVKTCLLELLKQPYLASILSTNTIKIPVCYHPSFGLDIEAVSAIHQLSINDVIRLHTAKVYRVFMIGFLPGFAYMGTVDEQLITNRKDQPRLQVAAGSVGIAGAQTGIYPIDSPGGWQIIGKTPLQLFNNKRSPACLLSAGDPVQFVAIDKSEFEQLYEH